MDSKPKGHSPNAPWRQWNTFWVSFLKSLRPVHDTVMFVDEGGEGWQEEKGGGNSPKCPPLSWLSLSLSSLLPLSAWRRATASEGTWTDGKENTLEQHYSSALCFPFALPCHFLFEVCSFFFSPWTNRSPSLVLSDFPAAPVLLYLRHSVWTWYFNIDDYLYQSVLWLLLCFVRSEPRRFYFNFQHFFPLCGLSAFAPPHKIKAAVCKQQLHSS